MPGTARRVHGLVDPSGARDGMGWDSIGWYGDRYSMGCYMASIGPFRHHLGYIWATFRLHLGYI